MEFRKGDKIKIGKLKTTVKGYYMEGRSLMIKTEYGDFNATLVKKDE